VPRSLACPAIFLAGALVGSAFTATSAALAQPSPGPQQAERGAMFLLSEEETRTIGRIALADPRVRSILGTDRPRVVSLTAEPDKAQAAAFLSDAAANLPSRRATLVLLHADANRAAQVSLLVPATGQPRVLEARQIDPAEVPLGPEDARAALDLAKRDPAVRRAVGDVLDRFEILDPGSDEQLAYAAQVLPLRSANPRDPCSANRCLDIVFRTDDGFLSLRPTVNLTRRTVTVAAPPAVEGGHRR
jgi:hypothetical protein